MAVVSSSLREVDCRCGLTLRRTRLSSTKEESQWWDKLFPRSVSFVPVSS